MKSVLTKQDILAAYQGAWTVNNKDRGEQALQRFGYSDSVHEIALDQKHFYIKGHSHDTFNFATVVPPSPSKNLQSIPVATETKWGRLADKSAVPAWGSTSGYGMLETPTGFYLTFKSYYAVSPADYPSQCMRTETGITPLKMLTGLANAKLPHLYHHNKVAGYMARPQMCMKASYLAGLCGTAGLALSSYGPSLYAVDFESGSAKPLLCYGIDSKLPEWDEVMQVRGCAWIETAGKHAVIFSALRSKGAVWYGEPDSSKGPKPTVGVRYFDKYRNAKGQHAEGYDPILMIYNPNDFNSENPSSARPTEIISLRDEGLLPLDVYPTDNVTASYSLGRLTIGVQGGVKAMEPLPLFLDFQF